MFQNSGLFSAPELASADVGRSDSRYDIWSFGVIAMVVLSRGKAALPNMASEDAYDLAKDRPASFANDVGRSLQEGGLFNGRDDVSAMGACHNIITAMLAYDFRFVASEPAETST